MPRTPRRGCLIAAAAVAAAIVAVIAWIGRELAHVNVSLGDAHVGPGSYTALDPRNVPNTDEVCRAGLAAKPQSAVTVSAGATYVRDAQGNLDAFDASTCLPRWSQPAGGTAVAGVTFAPAAGAHHVYAGGADGIVRALDVRTGDLQW